MTIHTAEELADAADAELKAIAAARTELRQAPECRPGRIYHCNKTICACWDSIRLARRDLITQGHPLRDELTEGN